MKRRPFMNWGTFAAAALTTALATAVLGGCGSTGKKAQPKEQTTGVAAGLPAAEFHVRAHQTQILENGLTILWLADDSLPYVSMQMMVKAGAAQEPEGKDGLAGFTAGLLDKGTTKRNALKISEDLEQIGSGFGVEVEPDYIIASASSLAFHKDSALTQFQEILLSPTFPAAELERERKNQMAGLIKAPDHPANFVSYVFPSYLYGGGHPYGRRVSLKTLQDFTQADVRGFYGRYFSPGLSVLAVVGQYDESFKQKVVETFKGWKSVPDARVAIPDFPHWKGTELLLINKSDLTQAQIQLGFKGIARGIPEYVEVRAALKILGEPFGSRLFEEIREKRALTYGIHSWTDPRLKTGPTVIDTFTRVEKTGEILKETLNVYRNFVKGGVTDEEVSTVKAVMRGQFPRIFETQEALARQLLMLNALGGPADYLETFYSKVDGLTKSSINGAIQKYFDPENIRIVVYAPRQAVEGGLTGIGVIETKDYKDYLQ